MILGVFTSGRWRDFTFFMETHEGSAPDPSYQDSERVRGNSFRFKTFMRLKSYFSYLVNSITPG